MDNPQAFPCLDHNGFELTMRDSGMTLRDWFAGQALCSIPLRNWDAENRDPSEVISSWARCAYNVADAMLDARKETNNAHD